MSAEKKFINVDELMPNCSVEDIARYYGVALPELHRVGNEIRSRCFLNCGKTQETGDRTLAVQANSVTKNWYCHQSGCGKSGNLISMCDLLKPGGSTGGRPRGQRFKEIAADLLAMSRGEAPAEGAPAAADSSPTPPAAPQVNLPLAQSTNERARALTELDRKFTVNLADLPPAASAYFRRRPFLTPESCQRWRVGYLPRSAGEDRSGGTMRGKIVYPYLSGEDEVLTWFGRDPEFEDKHRIWAASSRADREPEKFHFVKGFQRGLELFGQHRLGEPAAAERIRSLGFLPLVEGPNDVIRMDLLDVPALGLCACTITREQAAKAARLAHQLCQGIVAVFLDCDAEGESGMKQCLGYLAQLTAVRLVWTSKMFGGKFTGRQPESLTLEEWAEIEAFLRSGVANGWSLQ